MTGSFIRPEVKAWLFRWRETLGAASAAALGGWWFLTSNGMLAWIGGAIALAGLALALASFQRTMFRSGGGVGLVQLDEGRLTYFGPLTGGSIDVRDITEVVFDPRHRPAHWMLSTPSSRVAIPVDAEGATALFDVFSQLPGLDLRRVTSATEHPSELPATLWRKNAPAPPSRRLH